MSIQGYRGAGYAFGLTRSKLYKLWDMEKGPDYSEVGPHRSLSFPAALRWQPHRERQRYTHRQALSADVTRRSATLTHHAGVREARSALVPAGRPRSELNPFADAARLSCSSRSLPTNALQFARADSSPSPLPVGLFGTLDQSDPDSITLRSSFAR